MEKETLLRGKEIVGIISKQRLIHLHEGNCSEWMMWPRVSPAPQTQMGEQALLHLTSNRSHWACTRKEKEEGQKKYTFHIKSSFCFAEDIHRGVTFRLKTTFAWVFHVTIFTTTVPVQWSSVYIHTPAGTFPGGRITATSSAGSATHLNPPGSLNTSLPSSLSPGAPPAPLLISEFPFPVPKTLINWLNCKNCL